MDNLGLSTSRTNANYNINEEAFSRDLRQFHETRGTPIRNVPCINGKEINLYRLYTLVTSSGGWSKVNQRDEWDQILEDLRGPVQCVNMELALKQIYLRYLDKYERIHYLGNTSERSEKEDTDHRNQKRSKMSTRSLHSVAQSYNYNQHNVTEAVRATAGLSTNLYQPSEYERLGLSLVSPLPNEQDFAINVCALMSGAAAGSEGSVKDEEKNILKISEHPRIVYYLLAHASIYNHHSLRQLMEEHYKEVRKCSTTNFWDDVVEDKELKVLTDEKRCVKKKFKNVRMISVSNDGESYSLDSSRGEDDEDQITFQIMEEDSELFCLGRTYGTQDYFGQRVLQIAMIFRNITFIEENIPFLAKDFTFMRFVLLCCGSKYDCLHQLGFDMLSNVASELVITGDLQDHIVRIVSKGLQSHDRAVILSCMEAINKFGQKDANEDVLLRCLEQQVFSKICSFLSIQDIMMLMQTLECLYSLSSLGERTCNFIAQVAGTVQILVSLITVEAQSYGSSACILMRVVETVMGVETEDSNASITNGITMANALSDNKANTSSDSQPFSVPTPTIITLPRPLTPVSTTVVVKTVPKTCAPTTQPITSRTTTHKVAIAPMPAKGVVLSSVPPPLVVVTTPPLAPGVSASRSAHEENENFAIQWLRNTFEAHPTPGRGIEQGELYKQYLNACNRAGRKGCIAPSHFPRCVQAVFGTNVGPRMVTPAAVKNAPYNPQSKISVYEGIQVRISKTMKNTSPSSSSGTATPLSSPILKAQLSSPASTNNKMRTTSPIPPHLSSAPQGNSAVSAAGSTARASNSPLSNNSPPPVATPASPSPPTSTSSSNCSTSLIKTLLASKVCDAPNNKSNASYLKFEFTNNFPTPLVLNTQIAAQVAQRQQQQQRSIKKVSPQPRSVMQSGNGISENQIRTDTGSGDSPSCSFDGNFPNQIKTDIDSPSLPSQRTSPHPAMLSIEDMKTEKEVAESVANLQKELQTFFPDNVSDNGDAISPPNQRISPNANVSQSSQNVSQISNERRSVITSTKEAQIVLKSTVTKPNGMCFSMEQFNSTMAATNNANSSNINGGVACGIVSSLPAAETFYEGISNTIESCIGKSIHLDEPVLETSDGNNPYPVISIKEDVDGLKASVNPSCNMLEDILNGMPSDGRSNIQGTRTTIKIDERNANKCALLSEILENDSVKKDQPLMNGEVRIGENSIEFIGKRLELNAQTLTNPSANFKKKSPVKRRNSKQLNYGNDAKKRLLNGDIATEDDLSDEHDVKASSSAANLYAALAADVLGDLEDDEPSSSNPTVVSPTTQTTTRIDPHLQQIIPEQSQQIILSGQNSRQILVTSASNLINRTGVTTVMGSNGQQYIVAQPQSAIVQGQPQTVLVTQTPQQQGTSAKTIIILQAQNNNHSNNITYQQTNQQKVVMQRIASSIPMPVTTSSVMVQANSSMSKAISIASKPVLHISTAIQQHTPNQMMSGQTIGGMNANQIVASTSTASQITPIKQYSPRSIVISSDGNRTQLTTPESSNRSSSVSPNTAQNATDSIMADKTKTVSAMVGQFVCEWKGCMRCFKTTNEVYMHACTVHCPKNVEDVPCLWERCDAMKRKRFSLMTHLYDRHCNPEILKAMALRRKQMSLAGRTDIPAPALPPPHPGYAPNAAFHAIKRHALEYINSKEFQDENEGPVTKSIRLTSSLILRNLVIYSHIARRCLKGHEPHLSTIALSNVESSRTVAQILFELNDNPR